MNEAEFETRYQKTLLAIEETLDNAIDEEDLDLDYETVNDILTIECADGSAIIVTKQGGSQQLWLAAVSGGFHFVFNEESEQWQSTIDARTLADKLNEVCQLQAQVEIRF